MNKRENSPAFIAADQGFDVWLGNIRGNKYSRKHESLNPDTDEEAFFAYSLTDHGAFDIPAMINYIKNKTGVDKLSYVGHSMGTSMMFYLASTNPEFFTASIKSFTALGPVTKPSHCSSPLINEVADKITRLEEVTDFLSIYEIFEEDWFSSNSMRLLCGWLPWICKQGAELIATTNIEVDSEESLSVYLGGHYPSGTSTRAIYHYAQLLNSDRFQEFDHGPDGNMEKYG